MFLEEFSKIFQNSFLKEHSWLGAPDFLWLFLKNLQNTFYLFNIWLNKRSCIYKQTPN